MAVITDQDKFEYLTREFSRFVEYNQYTHERIEKHIRAVRGGKGMWDFNTLSRLDLEGRPPLTDNQLQRNVQIHTGYFIQNQMDFKWEGDSGRVEAPLELLNIYHRHIREINNKDMLDILVYADGLNEEGLWEYYWRMGEDGAKDIGVRRVPRLNVYKDPHSYELDWTGPTADRVKIAKWATAEDVALTWPELEGELKSRIGIIKHDGYSYEQELYYLKDRLSDFYDYWNGRAKVIEHWYYVTEKQKIAYDLENNQLVPWIPVSDKVALNTFMRNPENQGRYVIVDRKQRILWRSITIPAFFNDKIIVDEPHEIQCETASGETRMPIVAFSPLQVNNEAKGVIEDAIDHNKVANKLLTAQVHIAATNASNNEFASRDAFISDDEAERYAQKRSLPGGTFWMKTKYFIRGMLPKRQDPPMFDNNLNNLLVQQPGRIRDVMMTPDVISGAREPGEQTLGQFTRRQQAALTALAPIMAMYTSSQRLQSDIEFWMIKQLGYEGIERQIDVPKESSMRRNGNQIILNMKTDGGVANDLSKLDRGKVVTTQIVYTQSQRAEILDTLISAMKYFQDPEELIPFKKIISKNLPLPRDEREELENELAALYERRAQPQQPPIIPPDLTGAGGEEALPAPEETAAEVA